jgi:hypothetical protein
MASRLLCSVAMNHRAPRPSPTPPGPCSSTPDVRERGDEPEQRAAARVHVDAEVSLVSESNFFVGLTRNLSNGGLFVAT